MIGVHDSIATREKRNAFYSVYFSIWVGNVSILFWLYGMCICMHVLYTHIIHT